MLMMIGICRLSGGRIRIEVQKPQHSARAQKNYPAEKEARTVLETFGIADDAVAELFKLLPSVEENTKLSFPPLYVPQHALAAEFPDWDKQ